MQVMQDLPTTKSSPVNTEIKIGGTDSEEPWSTDSNLVSSTFLKSFVFLSRHPDLVTLGKLPHNQFSSSIITLSTKDDLVVLNTRVDSSALVQHLGQSLMGNVKMA